MRHLLFALAVLGLIAAPVSAQCFNRGTVIHHHAPFISHHVPEVVREVVKVVKVVEPVLTPVAVFAPFPVAIPTYSAAYNPALIGTQPAVAGSPYAAPPQGYAPPGGYAQPPAYAPPPAAQANGTGEVLAALKSIQAGVNDIKATQTSHAARLDALERRLGPPPGSAPSPVPPMPRAEEGPPPTPAGEAPPRGRLTRLSIAQAKCASCHSASNAKEKGGEFVILSSPSALAPLTVAQERAILVRTDGGARQPMPPRNSGIESLTDEEHAAWVRRVD